MAMVSLQAMYDDARRLLEGGDADQVIGMARHMLAHYPDYLEAYRILGEAYLANRQIDAATDAFTRVLRSDPENIPAHVGLGIAYERVGKAADAIAEFENALEIKPDLAELRSQLLRLYTDTWGSEHAQLRLSRAGLARLYVKGHMLPQAIQEFRAVVGDQPTRLDTRVALAEALWRDGQEDAAVTVCQEILRDYPDALKPNLMLGYLLLASGDPDGRKFWDTARALDPHMGVARTLFDTLPGEQPEPPQLAEFDEQAWRRQFEQERWAAQQPEGEAPVEPVVAAAVTTTTDDELFGAAWLSMVDQPRVPEQPTVAPTLNPADDDFLASLLALDTPTAPPPVEDDLADFDVDSAVAPFSFDDLATSTPAAPAEPERFSFDELGVDIAAVEPGAGETVSLDLALSEVPAADTLATEPTPPEVPQPEVMAPFVFDDLGMDDEPGQVPFRLDDLGLDEPGTAADDLDLKPFSLADLGLSDDEIAALGLEEGASTADVSPLSASVPPAAVGGDEEIAELPAELRPFSLDELDIDLGNESDTPSTGSLPQSLQPFSLDDIEMDKPDLGAAAADLPEVAPFVLEDEAAPGSYSWQEPTSRLGTGFLKSTPPDEEAQPETSIFSKLLQRRQADEASRVSEPEAAAAPVRDDELDMNLFSLDDVPLHDDEAAASPDRDRGPAGIAAGAGLLAGGLYLRNQSEPATPEPEAVPEAVLPASTQNEPELVPFSLAELGLSEEEIAALGMGATAAGLVASQQAEPATPEVEPEAAEPESSAAPEAALPASTQNEPELVPFSLAELGLSEEEIAALGMSADSATTADIPLLEPEAEAEAPSLVVEPEPEPAASSVPDVAEEPELKPFSLAELGLSDDEIAALGFDETGAVDDGTATDDSNGLGLSFEEIEAFDLGDLPTAESTRTTGALPVSEPAAAATTPATPDLTDAFDFSGLDSLDDLREPDPEAGSEPVDIDAFDLSELDSFTAPPAASAPSQPPADLPIDDIESAVETGMLQPFSLADLGLSAEEIAALGLEESTDAVDSAAAEESSLASFADANSFDLPSLGTNGPELAGEDLVVTKLLDLGQRQGFVDINDIIAVVDDPVVEADRIEAIGIQLHAAGIQIRDGDEIIDMDEIEYADEDFEGEFAADQYDAEPPPAAVAPAEPPLTPFSLAELGLSDEEIAALGLSEVESATPEPTAPFSLAELGLDEGVEEETPAPEVVESSAEPPLTPFSLAELGLSDEEIALLGLPETEAAPATAEALPPAEDVPADRGLPATGAAAATTSSGDEDALASLGSLDDLGSFDAVAPVVPSPANTKPMPLSAEEKASLAEKKDLVSNLLADLRGAADRAVRAAPEPKVEPEPATTETFETLVPLIDAEVPPPAVAAVSPAPPAATRSTAAAPNLDEGAAVIDEYLKQLKADPDNDAMRLAVARLGSQVGRRDVALDQYRRLVKQNALVDQVVDDLCELISESDDRAHLQRLHRVLGDAYSQQGRYREAINEYSWTFSRS